MTRHRVQLISERGPTVFSCIIAADDVKRLGSKDLRAGSRAARSVHFVPDRFVHADRHGEAETLCGLMVEDLYGERFIEEPFSR